MTQQAPIEISLEYTSPQQWLNKLRSNVKHLLRHRKGESVGRARLQLLLELVTTHPALNEMSADERKELRENIIAVTKHLRELKCDTSDSDGSLQSGLEGLIRKIDAIELTNPSRNIKELRRRVLNL